MENVEQKEPRRKYNPADYAQLQKNAEAMGKKELETFYINTMDKKHRTCGGIIADIIVGLMLISVLFFVGYSFGVGHEAKQVSNSIEQVSLDVCPILGSGYVSPVFFKSVSGDFTIGFTNRIKCTKYNSKPSPSVSGSLNSPLK